MVQGTLAQYATLSCAFLVRERLDLHELRTSSRIVSIPTNPFIKDYDAFPDERPSRLASLYDTLNWGIFLSFEEPLATGGAIVVTGTPGFSLLENKPEAALLQDIRVAPDFRGRGIGKLLIEDAVRWARLQGCTEMLVETQDINVPACRLYQSCGFTLVSTDANAYPPALNEVQLIWRKNLKVG